MSSPTENKSPPSANGESGNGIRLPPISFLSSHNVQQGTNRLPQSGNIGILRFLNNPNSASKPVHTPPQIPDNHVEKKPKTESFISNQEQQNQQQPYLHQYRPQIGSRASSIDKIETEKSITPVKGSNSGSPAEQQAPNPVEQPQNQPSQLPQLRHHHHHHHHHHRQPPTNPHHHHHHHHHHVNNRSATSSTAQSPSQSHNGEGESKQIAPEEHSKERQDKESTEPSNSKDPIKETTIETSIGASPSIPNQDLLVEKSTTKATKPEIPFPPVSLNTQPIIEILEEFFPSRRYLGAIVYNPTTTWSTIQTSQLYGLKPEHRARFEDIRKSFEERLEDEYARANVRYISPIPPLTNDYINYILDIKIPSRFINEFKQNFEHEAKRKRTLWGGASGVYTDDSDILSVLAHMGLFNDSIDLTTWNPSWKPQDIIKVPEEDGDLSVQLLLLPNLPQYHGYYANGINARSWVGVNKHTGLSMAVFNVKWETQGAYLGDPSIFKRYRHELLHDTKAVFEEEKSKRGWSFNYQYYKELKEKHSRELEGKRHHGNSQGSSPKRQ